MEATDRQGQVFEIRSPESLCLHRNLRSIRHTLPPPSAEAEGVAGSSKQERGVHALV